VHDRSVSSDWRTHSRWKTTSGSEWCCCASRSSRVCCSCSSSSAWLRRDSSYHHHDLLADVTVHTFSSVFFNLFVTAEPYASVKITHGTPCTDPWVQRRMQGYLRGIYGLISLAEHWGQNRHEDDKTDKKDQYKIWPH